ncbi:DUF2000 family protein [Myxococcus sp. K15C18031901]|uniref:DUF2000 family protein n=1 Tax=Myxococcus dinghuensis TaxID=2906761 RepID=UPI0020A81AD2|nr:DUF2000 family protein [Myxococcus dinghuensis]MCP3100559.1 DUF2000 family protein [Myxococcus dinghuensis]
MAGAGAESARERTRTMFATGNDTDHRAAFRAEDPTSLDMVGLALRGERKAGDKAVKRLSLHE